MKIATYSERVGQAVYVVWKQGSHATSSSVAKEIGVSQSYSSRILNDAVRSGMLIKIPFQHRTNTIGFRFELNEKFMYSFYHNGYKELFQDHHVHIKTRRLEAEYANARKGATSW